MKTLVTIALTSILLAAAAGQDTDTAKELAKVKAELARISAEMKAAAEVKEPRVARSKSGSGNVCVYNVRKFPICLKPEEWAIVLRLQDKIKEVHGVKNAR